MQLIAKNFNELTTTELYEILKARAQIFTMEQNIHYLDMDDIDYSSLHCFFMENGKVIAYLRAFYQDDNHDVVRLGRVLTIEHGNSIGKCLLKQSLETIKEKMQCKKISGNAQKHAFGFYEKLGFKAVSDDFIEAGVAHVAIEMELT